MRSGMLACVLVLLTCLPALAKAQSIAIEYEYPKKIEAANRIGPLNSTAFGNSTDDATGRTVFSNVDIDLPGNSALPVRLGRRLPIDYRYLDQELGGIGNWDIEVPYIESTFSKLYGWSVAPASSPNRYKRCSYPQAPMVEGGVFMSYEVSHGYKIHVPGVIDDALSVDTTAYADPTDGKQYPWILKSMDRLGCLPTLKTGQPGEGFVLLTKGGVKYYFDYMVERKATTLRKGPKGCHGFDSLCHSMQVSRTRLFLLATRAEDRFGNYVDYTYSEGRLVSIVANDGRAITIQYGTNSITATAAERVWTYTLQNGHLVTVANPDNSKWNYLPYGQPSYISGWDEGTVNLPPESFDPDYECLQYPSMYIAGNYFQVTHPSGALAKFSFDGMNFGRSHVMYVCNISYITGDIGFANIATPNYFGVYSLAKLEVSGPGTPLETTTFQYDSEFYDYCDRIIPANGQYATARCHEPQCADGQCVDPVGRWVTTIRPDGSKNRKRFGVIYGVNEGRLLAEQVLDAAGNVLRQTDYEYMPESAFPGQAFAPYYGISPTSMDPMTSMVRPVIKTETIEGGVTFKTEVPLCNGAVYCFDSFARPIRNKRSNTLGYVRTDVTEHHDNLNLWVLGQLGRGYNAETGIVERETSYNAQALPEWTKKHGKLEQSITYNTDGTAATVADGRNNITTLSNWKRGIPQQIRYPATPEAPAGATQSAVVDDNGWITATTDENGYVHGYGHDAMGRLAGIVYPSGDNVAWLLKAFEFRPTNANDWLPPGISVGQWRQYEGQGNYAKFTYFDAMWRPILVHEYDTTNVNPTLRSARFGYDTNGRQNFQSYSTSDLLPPALGSRTFYDALDRVVRTEQDSEHGVLGTTTEYLAGLQVRVTNPRSKQTTTGFMAWDQPGYDLPLWSSQPEGKVIEISRHPQFGWPLQVKQRSADNSVQASRQYVYDGNAQLCKTIEPETGATVMGYDGAGNPAWSAAGLDSTAYASTTDCNHTAASASGRVVNRTYDARNRLTHLTFPDGKGDQIWTYEKDNLPASVTAYNGAGHTDSVVTAYTYNKRRLLTGESLSQPSVYTWGIGYEYDTIGHVRWQSYPTGLKLDFAPNALGQATQARNANQSSIYYASGAEYFPNGALKQFTYGNGIVHAMTQNARQLPARVTSAGNVLDFAYDYDENGNPTTILDMVTGTPTAQHRWMSYDSLDRLTTSASAMFGGSDHTHRFTYDALDNIESWKHAGVKDYADYVYDARNRLTNIRNTAGATVVGLGYDDQGNLANKNGQSYAFDYGNRLRSVPGKEWYRYDGLGRRVQTTKTDDSQTTLWQYGQAGQMLFSTDWEGSNYLNQKTHESIYLAGSLIATIDHNWPSNTVIATKYQHTDALGSPVALTNEAGAVIERNNYEPYGAIIGNPTRSGIGYTGHVMDGATGLTYMQQRYYDQSIGRFLSVDPVTANPNTGGMFNRYNYAFDNPYRFTDPDGRAPPGCGDGSCEGPAVDTRRALEADRNSPLQPVYPEAVLPLFKGIRIISQVLESLATRPSSTPVQRMSQKNDPIPQKARDVDDHARANNGNSPAGHRGNIEYKNDGRGNGEILPKADSNGNAISYKEYDVNPFQKGVNRGAERVVRGSDGRSYYTTNHYKTFTEIKPK